MVTSWKLRVYDARCKYAELLAEMPQRFIEAQNVAKARISNVPPGSPPEAHALAVAQIRECDVKIAAMNEAVRAARGRGGNVPQDELERIVGVDFVESRLRPYECDCCDGSCETVVRVATVDDGYCDRDVLICPTCLDSAMECIRASASGA